MQLASTSPALLGALLALALSSGSVPAQMPLQGMLTLVSATGDVPESSTGAAVEVEPLPAIVYHDARLEQMVGELERESPTAASMLRTIRELGFPLTFGTFDDLAEEMQQEYSAWTRSPRSAAGYMAPVVRQGNDFAGQLVTVKINVAVNLAMLDEVFADAPTAVPDSGVEWGEVRRLETLSILAHELVHAYGLAVSGGDPRHGCHDPQEDEVPEASCVMVGENLVRREIGAPLDWDYGFPTAAVLASRYTELATRRAQLQEISSFRLPRSSTPPLRTPARLPIEGSPAG
jgi:hypothetical protein